MLKSHRMRLNALWEIISLVRVEASGFIKVRLVVALMLMVVSSALFAVGPLALQHIVDGFSDRDANATLTSATWLGLYVFCRWGGRSTAEIRGFVYSRANRRLVRKLNERVFAHILHLPFRFHLQKQTGAVTQALTNGLQGWQAAVTTAVFYILPVISELATVLVVLGRLRDPLIVVMFASATAGYAIVFWVAARRTMAAAKRASAAQVDVAGQMTDCILNYETIKYFGGETLAQDRIKVALTRSEGEWVSSDRQSAVMGQAVALVDAVFLFGTTLYAIHQVHRGSISLGSFVLVNAYMLQLLRPVETLGYAVRSLSQAIAYLDKLLELLREPTEEDLVAAANLGARTGTPAEQAEVPRRVSRRTTESNGPERSFERALEPGARAMGSESSVDLQGPVEVEFRNVWLSYRAERPVLKGVSFKVPAGRMVGIVGSTGSGKSTIGRMLMRLLDPQRGAIFIDGKPIDRWDLPELRRSIGVVPQDTVLFDASIGYNIGVGRAGSSQEEIARAARMAHIDDFVASLPEGYNTRVGERGVILSGGERQRVSIARAVLRQPRILLLDEPTASLDGQTELEIEKNLEEVGRGCTRLVIAHRLSTLVRADEILVLEDGVIVERGSHQQLLECEGRYAAQWAVQYERAVA